MTEQDWMNYWHENKRNKVLFDVVCCCASFCAVDFIKFPIRQAKREFYLKTRNKRIIIPQGIVLSQFSFDSLKRHRYGFWKTILKVTEYKNRKDISTSIQDVKGILQFIFIHDWKSIDRSPSQLILIQYYSVQGLFQITFRHV